MHTKKKNVSKIYSVFLNLLWIQSVHLFWVTFLFHHQCSFFVVLFACFRLSFYELPRKPMVQQFFKNISLWFPEFSSKLLPPTWQVGCWCFLDLISRFPQKVSDKPRLIVPPHMILKWFVNWNVSGLLLLDEHTRNNDQVHACTVRDNSIKTAVCQRWL